MDPSSINELVEELLALQRTVEIGGIVIVAVIILGWLYLKRSIQLIPEETSKKSLKRFQSALDKELFKYQTTHQKQVDAIHTTFQKFQAMISILQNLEKPELFTKPLKPREELAHLIQARHDFKQIYFENKILFNHKLCSRIENLIQKIDEFINEYNSGLLDLSDEEIEMHAQMNKGFYIAGLWSMESVPKMRKEIEVIANGIEMEFRKIYQTEQSGV